MIVLMNKTFEKMFKKIPVFTTLIIGGLLGFLLASQFTSQMHASSSYLEMTQHMMTLYSLIAFLVIVGVLLWVICANSATGLFASEIHEGTLRLLMSKELSRKELVLGKISGMLLGSMGYLIMVFAAVLFVFTVWSGADSDMMLLLVKCTAVYIVYGIVLIFIVGGLGTFLSTCFKKKVPAILILVALGALVFGILPIIRIILLETGIYNKWNLQFIDINYHLALIFNQFIEWIGGLSSSQGQLGMFSLFTNIYVPTSPDIDITLNTNSLYAVNQALNSLVVTIGYVITAFLLYALSFKKMARKDI